MFKCKSHIVWIEYNGQLSELTSIREIRHRAINTEKCKLQHIVLGKDPDYIHLIYKLDDDYMILIWDRKKDCEHSNFISSGEVFLDYMVSKRSKLGFVSFDKYIVDLDNGIPNPFFI